MILDQKKALDAGYAVPVAGIFRAERAEVVRKMDDGFVVIRLPDSLEPEKEYVVGEDCLIK